MAEMAETQGDAGALTVGVCGLGAMGSPVATRLVQSCKLERVVLHNRTTAKATALQKCVSPAGEKRRHAIENRYTSLSIVTDCP